MKQRFSSLDVQIIAHELANSLVSLRLANVYDLSSRIFLLKFQKPDHREQLLIDSGFRCHLTSFARATAAAPSPFVTRLRKFLKTRRCTTVQQIGTDRVIELQFSDGAYRLFLEFYAGGNIVLTDADWTILALLRNVSEGAEHEQYRSGLKYDLSLRQNYGGVPVLTKERIRDGLQRAVEKQQEQMSKPGKKIKKKTGDALRKALAVTTHEFPPILIDHALHVTGYDRDAQPEQVIQSDEMLDQLLSSLQEAQNVVKEITSAETARGYILAKRNDKIASRTMDPEESQDVRSGLLYDDFHPFKPAQLATDTSIEFLEFDGFNRTADEFFSSIEGQKLESKLQEREENAKRKIDAARQEQAKRIDGLQQVQELNIRKAQAIEANAERVEEAVEAVNGLIAQGMDWVDIGHLIENEQSRHNAVAEMIKLPLKLHENTVTLLLSEFDDVGEEDDMADETDSEASDSEGESTAAAAKPAAATAEKRLTIDIDLASSAWSNARQYYDQRRTAIVKQEKTAQASEKALKSTEQKVLADLKKGLKQEKDVLRPVRRQHWFEKFIYFVSSDRYLVLAGKDVQQNEILYRKHLKKGDVYVNADLNGAASVVIKNNPATPDAPIPPSTLSQAGNLSVCTSEAWDNKAVMSAWWVNADQVSKTAPNGEYLTTGGFVIKGKKNFLPPAQLLLGFAVLFQISEESKANHVKHRLREPDSETQKSNLPGDETNSGIVIDGSDDDDFDDAGHSIHRSVVDKHTNNQHDDDEDGDEDDDAFADAGHRADANANAAEVSSDEDDAGVEARRSNPLQSNDDKSTGAEDLKPPVLSSGNPQNSAQNQDKPDVKSNKPGPKAAPKVRGKRGKAKKVATKYADQDEEDRELAMKLLGSRAAQEKRDAEAAAKAANTESVEQTRARRRAQHEKAQKEGLQAEELRRLNLDDSAEDAESSSEFSLAVLDTLVGTPLSGDDILEAIPICAPWNALTKYKYKVKIQPGQQKKGKATREMLGKWQKECSDTKKIDHKSEDSERIWPREAELVKGWKEAEVVGVIPVKMVRVMMSGGSAGGGGESKGKGGKSGRGGKGSKRR
nr:ribosome quality control complex subunit 2 [Quercus suber]